MVKIYDEAVKIERDEFNISTGNILVLEAILSMMQDKVWRNKLRALVMEFKFKDYKKDGRMIL